MAWLLGFIASDGTIRKDANEIKIGLARRDKEILEKIKEELKLATNIRDYTTTDGYDCSTLQWTCAEHKEDLAKYNIIPAKTFQLKPPDKLDPKYYIDYIRGYFDGDGSVNFIKSSNPNHSGALRWQICAAKPEMLEWIMEVLYKQYDIPKVTLRRRKDDALCYIQYSTNSTKKIHEILYTPNSLCLARKKNHFDEIVNDKISPRDCISSSVEDKQVC